MSTLNDISFYQSGDLFQPAPQHSLNELIACVGINGGPYGFDAYALGYFESARRLWESIAEDTACVDVVGYPFTFLYRQGLELASKHLIFVLSSIYASGDKPKLNHELVGNWKLLRPYLERLHQEEAYQELIPQRLDAIERLLIDFESIDSGSLVFRYPTTKAGVAFLQNHSTVDLVILNDNLEAASNWFEDIMNSTREHFLN
ncbi:MAG: hypothetical protein ACKV2Q_33110 [Planctomycetaceae bacterium]